MCSQYCGIAQLTEDHHLPCYALGDTMLLFICHFLRSVIGDAMGLASSGDFHELTLSVLVGGEADTCIQFRT